MKLPRRLPLGITLALVALGGCSSSTTPADGGDPSEGGGDAGSGDGAAADADLSHDARADVEAGGPDADAGEGGGGDAGADGAADADAPPGCAALPTGLEAEAGAWLAAATERLTFDGPCQLDTEPCELRCAEGGTTTGPIVAVGDLQVCAVALASVTVTEEGSLTVVGPNPGALLVSGTISIAGRVRVTPGDGGGGLGGRYVDGPVAGTGRGGGAAGSVSDGFPGGGGGGGHASHGGRGGCESGGSGGAAYGSCEEIALLGGSGGGTGATEDSGRGGNGGGGLQLFSLSRIDVLETGVINADGAEGGTALTDGAGGGGGSGGTLLLEAPTILVEGTVSAAGGRGGQALGLAGGLGGSDPPTGGRGACSPPDAVDPAGSGGGGAAGRIFVRTEPDALFVWGELSPTEGACLGHSLDCSP